MAKLLRQLIVVTTLLLLAGSVGSRVALANEVNVANDSGFGTQVGSASLSTTGVGLTGTLTETVFLSGSTYTYEFSFAEASSSTKNVETATTGTDIAGGFSADEFVPANPYHYGEIGNPLGATLGGDLATSSTCNSGVSTDGFCFNSDVVKVFLLKALLPSQTFAFYAQSPYGPVPGSYTGQDGGTFNDPSTLDPGPEPNSMLLFGTGLLAVGAFLRRRLRA